MKRRILSLLLTTLIGLHLLAAQGTLARFYPDDPLWHDEDGIDTPAKPAEIDLSDYYDLFSNSFTDLGSPDWGEAANLNTLDEVPDSSWFTNRHGRNRMSLEELVRGPRQGGPPEAGTWTIIRSKRQGVTPGFHILDRAGRRYVIKLEQSDIAELPTGAEVVSTQIFHALGYWVPENYIVDFDPANFEIREGTVISDSFGDETPLTPGRLKKLLHPLRRDSSGKIRALASRYIPGEPLGPFRYYGTRSDDPNDVIPHENRRELRGLRLFAAWTNHDDTRAQNTQDSWVAEAGTHHVRHFLIDFGSTLGSGSVQAQLPFFSFHYLLDGGEIKRAASRFGAFVPAYRKVRWPEQTRLRGVGLFEGEAFDPALWKPNYPNPAFLRMTDRDAFWAAKVVMRFSPEELAAIVHLGNYSDPAAEAYVLNTLIARQRKIGREYLNRLNPLDDFTITGGNLSFLNLAEHYGVGAGGAGYQITWSVFDNRAGSFRPLAEASTASASGIRVPLEPGSLENEEYLVADIRTSHPSHPGWAKGLRVSWRGGGGGFQLVGIEREGAPAERSGSAGRP